MTETPEENGWVELHDADQQEWNWWYANGFPNDEASSIRVPSGYVVELYRGGIGDGLFQIVDSREHGHMHCVNVDSNFDTQLSSL